MPQHLAAHLQSYRAYQEHKIMLRMTNTEPEAKEHRTGFYSEEDKPGPGSGHSHNNPA